MYELGLSWYTLLLLASEIVDECGLMPSGDDGVLAAEPLALAWAMEMEGGGGEGCTATCPRHGLAPPSTALNVPVNLEHLLRGAKGGRGADENLNLPPDSEGEVRKGDENGKRTAPAVSVVEAQCDLSGETRRKSF